MKQCSVEGCSREAYARGWCGTHYMRWLRHGDVSHARRERPLCSMKGCGKPHSAKGFCVRHYTLLRRKGTPAWEPPSMEERFWAKVDRRGPDDCWPWTAGRHRFGHGQFHREHRNPVPASRMAWELTHGPIPDGLWVLHNCHQPWCCNPAHLRLGTHADNTEDMVRAGRQAMGDHVPSERRPRGDRHGRTRLSDADVERVRAEYVPKIVTRRALAERYGVSEATIDRVLGGQRKLA